MKLYTKDEVNHYMQEAYNMGQQDILQESIGLRLSRSNRKVATMQFEHMLHSYIKENNLDDNCIKFNKISTIKRLFVRPNSIGYLIINYDNENSAAAKEFIESINSLRYSDNNYKYYYEFGNEKNYNGNYKKIIIRAYKK